MPAAVLVDQRYRGQEIGGGGILVSRRLQMLIVDPVDNLQMPRQNTLEQLKRPALERLRQQRVIRIGQGAHGHPPCLVPRQPMLIDQKAHQFRYSQTRMRVVELDGSTVRQEMEVAICPQMSLQ